MSAQPKSAEPKSAQTRPVEKPSLTLKRRINAPPAKIFAAWTEAEKLAQWFGPADTVAGSANAELDVKVGGRFRVRFSHRERRAARGRRRLPRGDAGSAAGVHLGVALDAGARVARHGR